MNRHAVGAAIATLTAVVVLSCGSLSVASTPGTHSGAAGPVGLESSPVLETSPRLTAFSVDGLELTACNESALNSLGLGGPSPLREPPSLPYNANGLFWSERFLLDQGDILKLVVVSDSSISWFGVDWSSLDVRGVLAATDTDEDGWSFRPIYPTHSSVEAGEKGARLTITYEIADQGEYQLLVKNSNAGVSYHLSFAASESRRRSRNNGNG